MLNIQIPSFLITNVVCANILTHFDFKMEPFKLKPVRTHYKYHQSRVEVISYDDPMHSQK